MELIEYTIDGETVYIPKFEPVNKTNKLLLLGYKDCKPVLSSRMDSKEETPKQSIDINVKNSEKFIMVNGKKIKILAESELPKNSKIVQIASANKLPFKIIQGSSKIKALSGKVPTLLPFKLDKNKLTSEQPNKILLDKMVLKIPSTIDPIKVNTRDKCGIDTLKTIKGGKPVIHLKVDMNKTVYKNSNQHKPLDLTISDSSVNTLTAMKVDKSVQTELETKSVEVQTNDEDNSDDIFKWIFNSNDSLINELSSLTPKRSIDDNFDLNNLSDYYINLDNAPFKNIQNCATNTKQEIFFKELRSALQVNDKGNMPIHNGVLSNDIALVKRSCSILKILKQSVDIPNNNDLTPLQLAILNNSSNSIIHELLQNGAKIAQCDSEGNNILHYCVENNRTDALRILLHYIPQENVNFDQHNNEGLTPLMICCLNKSYDCAEILLEAKSDPNVKDQISGRTALFHAAELHDVDMVELLLQFNASTKIKNFFGTSPHDAMYEIEDMPEAIKFMILGKSNKRKANEELNRTSKIPPKVVKEKEKPKRILKTYARLETISLSNLNYPKLTT